MRNLKKILALVLAMIMVVSMMVTASATTFADNDDISSKYYEAVSVLSGIGVIRGISENADGSFNFGPKGALNRAQAATIVSYVLEGTLDTIGEKVSVYENPFTDVPEWAVPYVLYAHSEGIIVGRSATTFDPTATITGYELGKMLLIAGSVVNDATGLPFDNTDFLVEVYVVDGKAYTTEAEAFVASLNAGGAAITTKAIARNDWQVTVAKGLKAAKIWNGEFQLSKKLTREEACFLAFNTLVSDKSNKDLDTTVFKLSVDETTTDEFGRTTKTYTSTREDLKDTLSIALPTYNTPAVLVATANGVGTADVADLNTLLGLEDEDEVLSGTPTVFVNGDEDDSGIKIGDTVEYYVDAEGKVTNIVIIRETLEKASKVKITDETSKDFGKYTWSFGSVATTVDTEDAYTADASYLVVANSDKDLLDINVPTVISNAKITKADAEFVADATYVYVNDQKLVKGNGYVCTLVDGDGNPAAATFGKEYDYVLNSNGYLVALNAHNETITEVELETGYAYLLGAEMKITTDEEASSLIGGSTAYSWDVVAIAKLALADGTVAIVDLNKVITKGTNGQVNGLTINGAPIANVNDETLTDLLDYEYTVKDEDDNDVTMKLPNKGWVKYEIQEDGSYKLAAVTGLDEGVKLTKDKAAVGSKYASSATVWNSYVYSEITGTVTSAKNTGIASFDGKNHDIKVTVNADVNPNLITKIESFDVIKADAETGDSSTVYEVYYKGAGEYILGERTYAFYVAGEVVEYFIGDLEDGSLTASDLSDSIYTLTVNEDGEITKIVEYSGYTILTGVVDAVDTTFIVIDGNIYYYSYYDCYNVSEGHAGEADTAEVGDTVTFATKGSDGKIYDAFIIAEAE